MGEWDRIKKFGWYQQIAPLYGDDFPIQFRGILANFLVENNSNLCLDFKNPSNLQLINGFVVALKDQLNQMTENISVVDEWSYHIKESSRLQNQRIQAQSPMHLFQVVQRSLHREREMVDQLSLNCYSGRNVSNLASQTLQIRDKTFDDISREIGEHLANINIQTGKISGGLDELNKISQTLEHARQQHTLFDIQTELRHQLQTQVGSLEMQISDIITDLTAAHGNILQELKNFRDEQHLVGLGKTPTKKLDNFENWFKSLAQSFHTFETTYLPQFQALCNGHSIEPGYSATWAQNQIELQRQAMKKVALVIEKQPKQVIRTGTNFGGVKLRVLPWHTDAMQITSMNAVFINEDTAKKVCQSGYNHEVLPKSSANFNFETNTNKTAKRSRQQRTQPGENGNVIEYSKLKAAKKIRDEERTKQLVAQERFWIYFRVKVNWQERTDTLWILSFPIWVTTHPSQEPKAWPQVIWHNAFPNRDGLDVPEVIHSHWLIEAINLLFEGLGRKLSDGQKSYLKEIMFRGQVPPDEIVSKDKFCKEQFATCENSIGISFGEWICYCWDILCWKPSNSKSNVTELRTFWKQGKIVGFMGKQEIENILRFAQTGTFIIRFPESMHDFIGLYFYNEKAKDPKQKLLKLVYTSRDFNKKPLEDRILESPIATYLYSNYMVERYGNIALKAEAFNQTGNVDSNGSLEEGYFKAKLKEYFPSSLIRLLKRTIVEQQPNVPGPSSSFLGSFHTRTARQ